MSNRPPPPPLPSLDGREGRRSFVVKGLVGTVLLAFGGGTWLATRRTRPAEPAAGLLRVFSREEAAVLLAVADRLVPEQPGFPRPRALRLASRMDGVAAKADPATQRDLRRLVRLFESAGAGLLLDGAPRLFTTSSPPQQDRRLAAWRDSRIAVRRTGYRALKRLVYAAYYGSPETWAVVGYPGPPMARVPAAPLQPPPEASSADAPR